MAANVGVTDIGYKHALQTLYTKLEIQRPKEITEKLYEQHILDDDELDSITDKNEPKDQCKQLIRIIKEKSDKNIENFLDILTEDEQEDSVKLIRKTAWEKEKISSLDRHSDAANINDSNILVVGKTGAGKSFFCNNLSGTDEFPHAGTPGGVTKTIRVFCNQKRGRNLRIVDTPGTMDRDQQAIQEEIFKAIAECDNGYDAILIVCKYPVKFTEEDEKAITKFKLLFGDEVGPYCLVVFTGGDTYRSEMRHKNKTQNNDKIPSFKNYIEELRLTNTCEKFLNVLEFYKGGWILIDNYDKHRMDKQMDELLALIDAIRQKEKGKCTKGVFVEVMKKEGKIEKINAAKNYATNINCYPETSLVIIYPGKNIPISQVTAGDQVLARHKNGSIGYDTVYMQGHNVANTTMNAVTLTTSTGQCITASGGHFIHVTSADKIQTKVMRDVILGDYILVVYDKSHGYHMTSERVTKKEHTTARGMYNPFTFSGTIIVDNIIGTNYEEHFHPVMAHKLLAPVRGLYNVAPGLLRMINSFTYQGIPAWAYGVMAVVTWLTDMKAKVKCELF